MFDQLCKSPSDINEHLTTLRDLASECHHITEMGVRYIVSTYGFAEGLKKGDALLSIDMTHPMTYGGDLQAIKQHCVNKGINFEFRLGDTRQIEIGETDLLFIDTLHQYSQLKCELALHANKAKKYIVFHDTSTFATMGDDGIEGHGLWKAIEEFLADHKDWKIKFRHTNCNGLTCLEKCS
jgi:hypothetical protein